MDKREFIKITGMSVVGMAVMPNISCQPETKSLKIELPDLAFDFNALEPSIDGRTMEIHYGKHHAGYVKKCIAALESLPSFASMNSLEEIMTTLEQKEEHTALRNNAGGHLNHSMFWAALSPEPMEPSGDLSQAITRSFRTLERFKEVFKVGAMSIFGSGWAWLAMDENGALGITTTKNQDNPLMKNIADKVVTPLLGIDVWEHAYYLKYQNRRAEYVDNFFNIINWEEVAKRYAKAVSGISGK